MFGGHTKDRPRGVNLYTRACGRVWTARRPLILRPDDLFVSLTVVTGCARAG